MGDDDVHVRAEVYDEAEKGEFNPRDLKARDNYIVIGTDKAVIANKARSIGGKWGKGELQEWVSDPQAFAHAKDIGNMGIVMHYTDKIPASTYRHDKNEYYGKIAIGHELAHHAGIPGHSYSGVMRNGGSQFRFFTYTHNTIGKLADPTNSDNKTYYQALRSRYNAGPIFFDR